MMWTFKRPHAGAKFTFSRRSRISSMPRLDAASISIRSRADPAVISTHDWHLLHGSAESRARPVQLSAFASRRAADVFPVPRLPLKRYACATRALMIAPCSAREEASCPTRSPKVCERYFLYRDWYSGMQFQMAAHPRLDRRPPARTAVHGSGPDD